MVALPGIGQKQHNLPLGQLPVRLPICAALELLRLLLWFLPGPSPALPAARGLPILLLPGAHWHRSLSVPGHGGQTEKTGQGELRGSAGEGMRGDSFGAGESLELTPELIPAQAY